MPHFTPSRACLLFAAIAGSALNRGAVIAVILCAVGAAWALREVN